MQWGYEIADVPTSTEEVLDPEAEEWLISLLSEGWEPFAVTQHGGVDRIHLRQMILAEVDS